MDNNGAYLKLIHSENRQLSKFIQFMVIKVAQFILDFSYLCEVNRYKQRTNHYKYTTMYVYSAIVVTARYCTKGTI